MAGGVGVAPHAAGETPGAVWADGAVFFLVAPAVAFPIDLLVHCGPVFGLEPGDFAGNGLGAVCAEGHGAGRWIVAVGGAVVGDLCMFAGWLYGGFAAVAADHVVVSPLSSPRCALFHISG